jgi:hypothetical protein
MTYTLNQKAQDLNHAITVLEAVMKVDWVNILSMLDAVKKSDMYWPHADSHLRAFLAALSGREGE